MVYVAAEWAVGTRARCIVVWERAAVPHCETMYDCMHERHSKRERVSVFARNDAVGAL